MKILNTFEVLRKSGILKRKKNRHTITCYQRVYQISLSIIDTIGLHERQELTRDLLIGIWSF